MSSPLPLVLKKKQPKKTPPLLWLEGTSTSKQGSVLTVLAQTGYTREAHMIIPLSKIASLIGRKSNGGLPEFWDVMGKKRGRGGITRLMAVCITRGELSLKRALSLIADHSALLSDVDDAGRTPLHHALGATYPRDPWSNLTPINTRLVDIILALGARDADRDDFSGASVQDAHGNYPLHSACLNSSITEELVKHIIEAQPDALSKRNMLGHLPFFCACGAGASMGVIQQLFFSYPIGLSITGHYDNFELLPLHYAVLKMAKTDVIEYLLKEEPSAVSIISNTRRATLLHFACMSRYGSNIIQLILDEYPLAISIKMSESHYRHDFRFLPLHEACRERCDIDVIRILVNAYPEGVKTPGYSSNYPLHIAIHAKCDFETISLLFKSFPRIVECANSLKQLPIHIACSRMASLQTIKFLYNAYPDAIRIDDNTSHTPLQCAVASRCPDEIVSFLRNLY